MFHYPLSIRQKIRISYYVFLAIVLIVAVFTYCNLMTVENRIVSTELLHGLLDKTLEIRRYEKNYFLYKQENDYFENRRLVIETEEFVERHKEEFRRKFAQSPWIPLFQNNLREYRQTIERVFISNSKGRNPANVVNLEGRIRKLGREMVGIMEEVSRTEHENTQKLLSFSRRVLIISFAFVVVLGIVFGQVLSRVVIRPLKLLENRMNKIAEGSFEDFVIDSSDKEIVSFTNAFKRMLKELEIRQLHLMQSEKLASLGTMLSGVAHELNNPLSNVASSCQILSEEIEDVTVDIAYKKDLLLQIEEQADRMKNIVRSVLDFTRVREFKKESLSLKKLVEDTIVLIRGRIPTKIELAINVPEDIIIYADNQRLQQAFLNLIKNAIEAIEEGRITITAWKDMDHDTVKISFSDTGAGISSEIISKVFDPFFTTKRVGKGTGLGLFITHEIIAEHDGRIKVESKVGQGTTFTIELPLKGA
jgi:two-component system NtrC family sensor kinase